DGLANSAWCAPARGMPMQVGALAETDRIVLNDKYSPPVLRTTVATLILHLILRSPSHARTGRQANTRRAAARLALAGSPMAHSCLPGLRAHEMGSGRIHGSDSSLCRRQSSRGRRQLSPDRHYLRDLRLHLL